MSSVYLTGDLVQPYGLQGEALLNSITDQIGIIVGVSNVNATACSSTEHWSRVSSLGKRTYHVFFPKNGVVTVDDCLIILNRNQPPT